MKTFLTYYKNASIFTIVALIAGAFIGYAEGGVTGILPSFLSVLVLSILEVSLSLDNAVVNCGKLKDMDEKWQQWFLRWGMLIAVVGLRLILPIVIVSALAFISPLKAVELGLFAPKEYAAVLQSSHHLIAAFGGGFLLMVSLSYYTDTDKDVHWIKWIEAGLSKAGGIGVSGISILTAIILFLVSFSATPGQQVEFCIAGVAGVILFLAIHFLQEYLESRDEKASAIAGQVVKSGLMGVLYLEVLDASLSFDGLLSAFAISDYFLIIMLGLGTGAYFVRSMTLHLLHSGHLAEYRFLENGAFAAITALSVLMLASFVMEVPEWITGLIGIVFLAVAFVHSAVLNKKESLSNDEA